MRNEQNPTYKMAALAGVNAAAILLLTLQSNAGFAHSAPNPACATPTQQLPEIIAARSALQHAPEQVSRRLELVDLLIKSECYDEAARLLEEGQQMAPRNVNLQNRLTRVRSMLRERQYFENLDEAEATAKVSRSTIRCTRLGEISACDEVLSVQPTNAEAILAKGDALAKANKINDALLFYSRSAEVLPGNASIAGRLQALQSQRKELLHLCTTGAGEAALQACLATLVHGAANEFDQLVRISILQQSTNQASKALDTFIAANSLRQGDKSVALAILALLDSTQRKDAVALAARGSSLMTLGRAGEAVEPLRQAYALAPELPDIGALLASATMMARKQANSHAAAPIVVSPKAAGVTRSYSNSALPGTSN